MKLTTFLTRLNFQQISKLFFDIVDERYLSPEKIKQLSWSIITPLTTDMIEVTIVNIAILNIVRNMIREVSPNYIYRSIQHRDEVYTAVINTLEDLEDKLEELEEQQEEAKDKEKNV